MKCPTFSSSKFLKCPIFESLEAFEPISKNWKTETVRFLGISKISSKCHHVQNISFTNFLGNFKYPPYDSSFRNFEAKVYCLRTWLRARKYLLVSKMPETSNMLSWDSKVIEYLNSRTAVRYFLVYDVHKYETPS